MILESAVDRANLRSSLDLAGELLFSAEFGRVAAPARVPRGADFILENLGTSLHLSGSCRMGAGSDGDSVVVERCRVIGAEGLWVADTSVMPAVTSRGPHATAVMIAARVSA